MSGMTRNLFLLYPLVLLVTLHLGGYYLLVVIILNMLVMPGLDLLAAPEPAVAASRPRAAVAPREQTLRAEHGFCLLFLVALGYGAASVRGLRLDSLEFWLRTYATGLVGGTLGFVVAHELIHRRGRLDRCCGVALLTLLNYGHFRVEHVFGHHANVGLAEDPASARRGQTVYGFYLQSIPGQVRSALAIETRRLRARGHSPLSLHNQVLSSWLVSLSLAVGCYGLWGLAGLCFFIAQGLFAVLILETVNYVEHYGLRRQVRAGRVEKVSARHAWSTGARWTNRMLLGLGKHADHHLNAARPHTQLAHLQAAPTLPLGYFASAFLALIPPLWFAVMDPLVAAQQEVVEHAR
ncbi:MAG: alkane 1-monooxygenase [Pseudomonas sp.]|uniref:alkane 1-monooxygenase n=1 Tax=Pseudomonas sp. TaxID=306 RepID=UPI00339834FB